MHDRSCHRLIVCSLVLLTLLILGGIPKADVGAADPGPRDGLPGAGGPLPGLSLAALQLFLAGQAALQEIDSVQGTMPDTGLGLGPRFNMDSCGGCHAHPAPGGASPPVNPQALCEDHGLVPLSRGQDQGPQLATPFGPQLDCGTEPAPAPAKGFGLWVPVFAPAAC
jgi:hypothetical protein